MKTLYLASDGQITTYIIIHLATLFITGDLLFIHCDHFICITVESQREELSRLKDDKKLNKQIEEMTEKKQGCRE